MYNSIIFLFISMGSLCGNINLPHPYNTLSQTLPYDNTGWYRHAKPMEALIKERAAKVIIELGVWKGTSAIHIARCLPEDGVLFAVDHWFCPPYDKHIPIWYQKYDTNRLYEQFLSNIIIENLTQKIVPLRMSTLEAIPIFYENMIKPDIVYIDASHDEHSVYEDIKTYFTLVKGHGVLCGDDWSWGTGWGWDQNNLPVKKAVSRFAQENHLSIKLCGDFWVLYE